MNPPGHHPDAKDFVAVNATGAPYPRVFVLRHIFYKLNIEDTFAWGRKVYAPFSGTVRSVENHMQDRRNLNLFRDLFNGLLIARRSKDTALSDFLGNHIIIESNDGIFALLAHLQKNSLLVNVGEQVTVDDCIGSVGNSGNTIQPHLHLQLMTVNDPSSALPIPFTLSSYQRNIKGYWKTVHAGLPGNFEHFRV